MQGIAYFAHTACAAAALVVLTACTPPPPGLTYDEYVGRWVEDTEVSLVLSWGIPEKTHSLMTGGRIVEFTRKLEVVSDSWWKFDLGVAPSPNGHSIMRRGQGKARLVRDRGSASHRPGAW